MALTRWVGWVREVIRVMRGLPDEDLRRQTLAMHEQLIRLRQHRLAQEEIREKAALSELRKVVEEMQQLQRNLVEAEKATAEYVDSLAEQAKTQMEADLNVEADIMIEKVLKQKPILPSMQDLAKGLSEEGTATISAGGAPKGKAGS